MAKKNKKKIGRNDPCPCGSGKKYKKCCLQKDKQREHEELQQQQAARELAERNWNPFGEPPDPEDLELFEDDPTAVNQDDFWAEDAADDEDWDDRELDWEDEGTAWEGEDDFPINPAVRDVRWEAPDIKKIPKDTEPLSEEERTVVDDWWTGYKELNHTPDRIGYLEALFVEQPDLAPKVDWPEAAFGLVSDYADITQRTAYAAFLMRLRREWPDLYLPDFGYFDRDIIMFLVIAGRKDELPEFLSLFREYPSHDPDNLFAVIRFLTLTDCEDALIPFVRDICHEVCYSPKLLNGAKILHPVIASYWMPYLRPDVSDEEFAELAELMQTVKGPVNQNYFKPEFLKQEIGYVTGEFTGWDIADCATIQDVFTRYYHICQNFMGFLHREKGKGWLMAEFLQNLIFEYFEIVTPEGKRPREAFGVFTKNKIDRTVGKLGKDLLFVYPSRLFGALNAVYYFAEYLGATASISGERSREIQDWCTEMFEGTYPSLGKHFFSVKAFEQFPL